MWDKGKQVEEMAQPGALQAVRYLPPPLFSYACEQMNRKLIALSSLRGNTLTVVASKKPLFLSTKDMQLSLFLQDPEMVGGEVWVTGHTLLLPCNVWSSLKSVLEERRHYDSTCAVSQSKQNQLCAGKCTDELQLVSDIGGLFVRYMMKYCACVCMH